jgi:ABC-type Fe3+-hydroxamate transport system substrate-binding protein
VLYDDTGALVEVPAAVGRVVSLVPSLTESVALSAPGLLVGATDWCSHPPDLDVVRVKGTKSPSLAAVIGLRPDLVLANFEENRPEDIEALRAAGIAVWVTVVRTVPEAVESLGRMLAACGVARPLWLDEAEAVWNAPWAGPRRRAVIPIWRRPWMAVGSGTFTGDVLSRLGVDNVLASSADRYPKVELSSLPEHDLVVLPDEPYAFSPVDGPECFTAPAACVSGRHLTWYGPSLIEARDLLLEQLAV